MVGRLYTVVRPQAVYRPYTQESVGTTPRGSVLLHVGYEEDFTSKVFSHFRRREVDADVKGGPIFLTGSGALIAVPPMEDGAWSYYLEEVVL